MPEALWKNYQYKLYLAYAEKKHSCYFAENYMQKYLFSKMLG